MEEQLREKHLLAERRTKERRQLLFQVECNCHDIPDWVFPNARMIYRALTEKMDLSAKPSPLAVEPIYAPNPNTPWSWWVLFNSEETRVIFEAKQVELSWSDPEDNPEYTYRIRTKAFQRNLITNFQSSPLITSASVAQANLPCTDTSNWVCEEHEESLREEG